MTTALSVWNPFDLPELRRKISKFVAVENAISCARVAKSWADVFIPVIWFKLDFKIHSEFEDLSPDIISKHGHLIRIVRSAKSLRSITALAHTSVHKLRELEVDSTASVMQYVRAYEIISRNIPSLQELSLFGTAAVNKVNSLAHFVQAPALVPFSAKRIKKFSASIDFIFPVDNEDQEDENDNENDGDMKPRQSSLLYCFPNLRYLSTWKDDLYHPIATARIREELAVYWPCTALKSRHTAWTTTRVVFDYAYLTIETIAAILLHKSSLEKVKVYTHADFCYEEDGVAEVSSHFEESGPFLQLIPRCCPLLKTLDLHLHEMSMDDIEMDEWACKGLKTLRIRVKDLDTEEKIVKAIELWRKGCWRRWQEQAGVLVRDEGRLDKTDISIEACVARHLLRFDKLWRVWLGYQTWTPI
ncbi:hypothetical protein BGX24_010941 [Mortierella sp. AD032]|nr:hypothetical protein BGX24_010941 [Mortierella sp. AD032]